MLHRILIPALLICLPLIAPSSAFSAENIKLVPQKVINSKGYVTTLKDGTKVKVVNIKNMKEPKKQCSLDVNSVARLSIDSWSRVGMGAKAEITLQAKVGQQGHPYCSGKGSGCVMTVEVPDAKVVAEKLMR